MTVRDSAVPKPLVIPENLFRLSSLQIIGELLLLSLLLSLLSPNPTSHLFRKYGLGA